MNEQAETREEVWQAEIDGSVRSLVFNELAGLIASGIIAPTDKVRRGNLRWLEAGRVPSLAGYFTGAAKPLPDGPAVERNTDVPVITSLMSETVSSPVPAVSNSSVVKSFAVVLLLSLVLTYVWMYHRHTLDRANRLASSSNPANSNSNLASVDSVKELEAMYEKEKNFLTEQKTATENAIARIPFPASRLTPTGNIEKCYRYKNFADVRPADQPFYPTGNQQVVRELDPKCVEQQRKTAREEAISAERDRNMAREELMNRRAEIIAQMESLESETDMERGHLTEAFYMMATKGRFYSAFIPIFLLLSGLNTTRIVFKKKLARTPRPSS